MNHLQHPYELTVAQRQASYRQRLQLMAVPPEIQEWAANMALLFGPKVAMHNAGRIVMLDGKQVDLRSYAVDWVTALCIARYGEEPDASKTHDGVGWPSALGTDDIVRANRWLYNNDVPVGVMYLPRES